MPVDILPALRRMKIEDDVKVVFFAGPYPGGQTLTPCTGRESGPLRNAGNSVEI